MNVSDSYEPRQELEHGRPEQRLQVLTDDELRLCSGGAGSGGPAYGTAPWAPGDGN